MGFKERFKSFFEIGQEESWEASQSVNEQRKQGDFPGDKKNVVSLSSVKHETKMVLCEPKTYEEATKIADHLKKRQSTVINVQQLEPYTRTRVIDFLSGTVYALNGNIQKLGSQTFLCTPEHVNISGSISQQIDEEKLRKER